MTRATWPVPGRDFCGRGDSMGVDVDPKASGKTWSDGQPFLDVLQFSDADSFNNFEGAPACTQTPRLEIRPTGSWQVSRLTSSSFFRCRSLSLRWLRQRSADSRSFWPPSSGFSEDGMLELEISRPTCRWARHRSAARLSFISPRSDGEDGSAFRSGCGRRGVCTKLTLENVIHY